MSWPTLYRTGVTLFWVGIGLVSGWLSGIETARCEESLETGVPPLVSETFVLPEGAGQPGAENLAPGLAVSYLHKKFRHIDDIPETSFDWVDGKPLSRLNHRFNGQEPVFDSGLAREVGLRIRGFIYFSRHGNVELQAKSNDGIRVWVSGIPVIEDPDVHSDRFSRPVTLVVPKPGYYPVQILYFQRKGSACLEMYWKEPGDPDFSVIPEKAFFHLSRPGN